MGVDDTFARLTGCSAYNSFPCDIDAITAVSLGLAAGGISLLFVYYLNAQVSALYFEENIFRQQLTRSIFLLHTHSFKVNRVEMI